MQIFILTTINVYLLLFVALACNDKKTVRHAEVTVNAHTVNLTATCRQRKHAIISGEFISDAVDASWVQQRPIAGD